MSAYKFICDKCNEKFTLYLKAGCSGGDRVCPRCGSHEVRKNSLLDFFRGILRSGGG